VVGITLLYNIPKFFELHVQEEFAKSCSNSSGIYNMSYSAENINETR
jgi:hypothetical protein